jgi:predicted transcriptional regulator YdeE
MIKPQIIDLKEPIKIIGLKVDTDVTRIYHDAQQLVEQFERYKKANEIPNKRQPWAFAAVSKDFDEEKKTFSYLIGDVVTSLEEIPQGLIPFEIPAIKYAVFPIRPKSEFAWGEAIASIKKYAYTEWLPNSKYELAKIIDDVEYHDERSLRKENPESDLYVAVKEKTGIE